MSNDGRMRSGLLPLVVGLLAISLSAISYSGEGPGQRSAGAAESPVAETGHTEVVPLGQPPIVPLAAEKPEAEDEASASHELLHRIGQVGAMGVLAALAVGLFIAFTHPRPRLRRRLRITHFLVGALFGLASMTHGTAFFFNHLRERAYGEIFHSGSWLCTSVFFLLATGLLRAYSPKRTSLWRKAHRVFQVVFVLAFLWHVVPKVM
jgi:multisubunit Na+/H+ antiporter MnhB subunit